MKTSIKDIAEATGFSTSTVSRAFSTTSSIEEKTRRTIFAHARRLNYSPKMSSAKKNIGVLVEGANSLDISDYSHHLITGMLKQLILRKRSLEIIPVEEHALLYRKYLDGVIALLYEPENLERLSEVDHLPVMTINNPMTTVDFHSIKSDHYQGVELAIDYLIEMNHRKIAMVTHESASWGGSERVRAYSEVTRARGLECYPELFLEIGEFDLLPLVRLIKKRPTALIVCGEDFGKRVSAFLNLMEVRCPDELSVVYFENHGVSEFLHPAQTAVCQPIAEMARLAVDKLIEVIDASESDLIDVNLKHRLIERESVRKL